jgi:hypothetical protein
MKIELAQARNCPPGTELKNYPPGTEENGIVIGG